MVALPHQTAAAVPVGAGAEPCVARHVGLKARPTPARLITWPRGRCRRFGVEATTLAFLRLAFPAIVRLLGRKTSEERKAFLLLLL